MSATIIVDSIARERIDALKEDISIINNRLDLIAQGAMVKLRGDTELATQLKNIESIVISLDNLLVRGETGTPSVKSSVENLQSAVRSLETSLEKLAVQTKKDIKAEVANLTANRDSSNSLAHVAITSKSENWKTTATLIASIFASLVALAVAIFK